MNAEYFLRIFEVFSEKYRTTLDEYVDLSDLIYQDDISTNERCVIKFMFHQ